MKSLDNCLNVKYLTHTIGFSCKEEEQHASDGVPEGTPLVHVLSQ